MFVAEEIKQKVLRKLREFFLFHPLIMWVKLGITSMGPSFYLYDVFGFFALYLFTNVFGMKHLLATQYAYCAHMVSINSEN